MAYDISKLNHKIIGSGKSILFLHGWGQDASFFDGIVDLMSNQYTCICIDLPGWGLSPLDEFLSIDDYTNIINRFVKEKQIDLYAIIGHSWGGKIAFNYALKYQIKKLVLAASSTCKPRFNVIKKIKIINYKLLKRLAKIRRFNKIQSKLNSFGSSDYKNSSGIKRKVFLESIHTYYDDVLFELDVPTLIYWGEKDKETPLYMAKRLHKEILDSKLKIVKKGDHFVLKKCRYNFTIVVQNFLKEGN